MAALCPLNISHQFNFYICIQNGRFIYHKKIIKLFKFFYHILIPEKHIKWYSIFFSSNRLHQNVGRPSQPNSIIKLRSFAYELKNEFYTCALNKIFYFCFWPCQEPLFSLSSFFVHSFCAIKAYVEWTNSEKRKKRVFLL